MEDNATLPPIIMVGNKCDLPDTFNEDGLGKSKFYKPLFSVFCFIYYTYSLFSINLVKKLVWNVCIKDFWYKMIILLLKLWHIHLLYFNKAWYMILCIMIIETYRLQMNKTLVIQKIYYIQIDCMSFYPIPQLKSVCLKIRG